MDGKPTRLAQYKPLETRRADQGRSADLNQTVRAAVAPYPHVEVPAIEEMIASLYDVIDIWHFAPLVHHRIYQPIIARLMAEGDAARRAASKPPPVRT